MIKIFLRHQKVTKELYIVNSGEEALDFLYRCGDYGNGTAKPDLILLDLNLPAILKEIFRFRKYSKRHPDKNRELINAAYTREELRHLDSLQVFC